MTQYRAVVGIDYPPNKRAEAGEIVSDLPEKSIVWLLANDFIEELDGKKSTKKTASLEPVTKVEFKPDAVDGDGDGFVQDGTIHQRPVKEKE